MTSSNSLSISVAMPVYNEAGTVRDIVRRVQDVPIEKEIILVDDGSVDGSQAVLAELGEEPGIRALFQERNQGKGAALWRAFAAAENDIVIIQDADLEYDPADYLRLVAPFETGLADVVYGSRYQHGARRVPRYRHSMINVALTTISNLFTNLYLTDMETCYKAFRREVIQNIPLSARRFGFEPEITAKLAKLPVVLYEVPIAYRGRGYDEGKKIGWKDGVSALWHILRHSLAGPPRLHDAEEFHAALVESRSAAAADESLVTTPR